MVRGATVLVAYVMWSVTMLCALITVLSFVSANYTIGILASIVGAVSNGIADAMERLT